MFFSRGGEVKTTFGFEDEGGKHYNVSISGLPRVESGMTVIALLTKDNDWSSLVGWVDIETGEVVGINSALMRVSFIVAFFGIITSGSAITNSDWFSAICLGTVAVAACMLGLRTAKLSRELKALTPRSSGSLSASTEL